VRPIRTWWRIYPFQLGINLGLGTHPACPIDRVVVDGDEIGPLQVVHTPGHSPGHLAFYWSERRALFAGDAVVTWPTEAPGWPAFNLNPTQHRASLGRLAGLDVSVIGVGHGEPITRDAAERLRRLAAEA
jgi:glyoxylase-like metal-dependent hydrolase (beta-lactamase superfamily II)